MKADKTLLYNTGSPAWCSVEDLEDRIGEGRETQEGQSVQLVSSVAQPCPILQPHESKHARPPCLSSTLGVSPNSFPLSR